MPAASALQKRTPASLDPNRVRLTNFSAGNATAWQATATNVLHRTHLYVPKKGRRFRFRYQNWNDFAGAAGIGSTLTLGGIAVGPGSTSDGTTPDGNFSTAPTLLVPQTVMPADGSPWYSPWFDAAQMNAAPGDLAIISWGVAATISGGFQWARSGIGSNFYVVGKALTDVATQTLTLTGPSSPAYGEMTVQWETSPGQFTCLFIGDSITEGYGATGRQSFPNQFGQTMNAGVITAALSGVQATQVLGYGMRDPFWLKAGVGSYLPDAAFLFIGTNDLASNRTDAQTEADLTTLFNTLKGLRIPRIYGSTIMPRGLSTGGYLTAPTAAGSPVFTMSYAPTVATVMQIDSTAGLIENLFVQSVSGTGPYTVTMTSNAQHAHAAGAIFAKQSSQEAYRVLTNIWLRANSLGYDRVFDFDTLMKDGTDGTKLATGYQFDSTHPTAAGYTVMANAIRSIYAV